MTARIRTPSPPGLQNGERAVSGRSAGHPFEIGQWSSPWRAATLSDPLTVEKSTHSPTGRALLCGYEFIRHSQGGARRTYTALERRAFFRIV
jgi:hypothetical protein